MKIASLWLKVAQVLLGGNSHFVFLLYLPFKSYLSVYVHLCSGSKDEHKHLS